MVAAGLEARPRPAHAMKKATIDERATKFRLHLPSTSLGNELGLMMSSATRQDNERRAGYEIQTQTTK